MTIMTLRKIYITMMFGAVAFVVSAGPSILDIKHSITDDNVIPPESFETKTRELEENFYLKKYTAHPVEQGQVKMGNPEEYEQLLSRLPTEIEMPYNPVVGRLIEMYLGKRRGLVADMLALHNYYGKIFIEELIKEKVPLELQYLPVIESAINPNAVSRMGAGGLWQFMPATATGLGMEVNSLVDQRRDPRVSSRYAAKYLKQLYNIYGDWSLAIAAYNCGPGNVNKALRRAGGGKKDFWEIYNYLPSETRGYVPAFIAANFVMNYHDRYGIRPTLVKQQLVTDTVEVANRVHFRQIADVLNIPVEEIRMLNPQFRKDIIPGDNHPYSLVLPSQQCLSYIISEDAILSHDSEMYERRTYVEPGVARVENGATNDELAAAQTQNAGDNKEIAQAVTANVVKKTHIVGRGENLRDIAKKYGVSATDVKRWNNLRRGKVKEGDELTIEVYERTVAQADVRPTTPSTVTKRVEGPQTSTSKSTKSTNRDTKSGKAKKPSVTNYTVKSGDNLEKIAKRHGVSVADIQAANGMSKGTTRINVGQKIKIPAAGSGVSSKSTAKSRNSAVSGKKSTSKKSGTKKRSSKKRRR